MATGPCAWIVGHLHSHELRVLLLLLLLLEKHLLELLVGISGGPVLILERVAQEVLRGILLLLLLLNSLCFGGDR